MSDEIDMEGWPPSLREIAEHIGSGAALKLIDAYAGRDAVHVPAKLRDGHGLIEAIGEAAAQALVRRWGGDRIDIPTLAVRRILRRKKLIRDASGTNAEIARRFGVSPRWVRYVKNEARPDSRQMDLFGGG